MINIQGKRLYLKTFTREEYHNLYKIYVADPVMDPDKYTYDKEKVDKSFDVISQKENFYPRVGIFLSNGQIIGEISFKRIDREESRCELGIILANGSYKRQGYGTEAVELAIVYAFESLRLRFLYADTMGSNIAMQKIFDKLGFKHIGTEERRYDMHDRWEDKLIYVLENPNASQ